MSPFTMKAKNTKHLYDVIFSVATTPRDSTDDNRVRLFHSTSIKFISIDHTYNIWLVICYSYLLYFNTKTMRILVCTSNDLLQYDKRASDERLIW